MTDPSDKRQTDHLLEAIGIVLLLFFMWSWCGVRPGQILLPREPIAPPPAPPREVIDAGEAGWFQK